jgi:quinoprotein glucose dehydrogenase
VFIGATLDRYLRAFDARSGAELWAGRLPASAIATPLSYAGGALGDALVAFALPRRGESGPGILSKVIDRPGGRFTFGAVAALLLLVLVMWGLFAWRTRRSQNRR